MHKLKNYSVYSSNIDKTKTKMFTRTERQVKGLEVIDEHTCSRKIIYASKSKRICYSEEAQAQLFQLAKNTYEKHIGQE